MDGVGVKGLQECQASPGGLMTTNISAGHIVLIHISPYSGVYHGYNDATINLAHDVADASPRKDLICAEVIDAQYDGGALNKWQFRVVKGTTGAYPNPPALPANGIPICYVNIPNGTTVLGSGNYEDRRWFYTSHGGVIICTSTTRPGTPSWNPYLSDVDGMTIYETDTKKKLVYMGATLGWRPDWAMPWGELAYVQSTTLAQTGTAVANLTGMTLTVTPPAGRKLLVTAQLPVRIDGDGDRIKGWIREGSTILGCYGDSKNSTGAINYPAPLFHGQARISGPSAAAHTYVMSLERTSGTAGNWNTIGVSADEPAWMRIDDIGPV